MHGTVKLGVVSLVLVAFIVYNVESFECEKRATTCETKLVISHFVTMLHPIERAVYPSGGKLYRYDVRNTSDATPINESEVIVGDGYEHHKLVVIFNMSMPGPDIIVYEGQRLIVTVENELLSEAVTVHWHGLPQRGSPYMDGVPFITQCPINPGSSFKYDFIVSPKGTYWYHSHMGGQRSEGAFGALIIRENQENSIEEHIIQIQEWSHNYGTHLALQQWKRGRVIDRVSVPDPITLDESTLNFILIDSALINGKGRYRSSKTNGYNSSPLQVYKVHIGKQLRFRVIGVGATFPFRVSVDNHTLTIVAMDGHDVKPVEYESFIIHPGERYDFILNATGPMANYWIRGKSLQVDKDIVAWAILRYVGAPDEEPTLSSRRIPCTSSSKCYILNCPFPYYPVDKNVICHDVTKLKSLDIHDTVPIFVHGQSKEHHFTFLRHRRRQFATNGKYLIHPAVSAISQPNSITATCDNCIEDELCSCTHAVTLNHGETVQIILFNVPHESFLGHPMHLHGHSFYVLKTGFSSYNETDGRFTSPSNEIECLGRNCFRRRFTNLSWHGNDIPGLELDNPPRKDTIFLPRGGYVVIRIKADNPGLWMMHCHSILHSMDNFAFLFNESFNYIPRKPDGFPECNTFPSTHGMHGESTQSLQTNNGSTTKIYSSTTSMMINQNCNYKDIEGVIEIRTFWIVVGIFVCIILVQLLFNIKMTKNSKNQASYLTDITTANGQAKKWTPY